MHNPELREDCDEIETEVSRPVHNRARGKNGRGEKIPDRNHDKLHPIGHELVGGPPVSGDQFIARPPMDRHVWRLPLESRRIAKKRQGASHTRAPPPRTHFASVTGT